MQNIITSAPHICFYVVVLRHSDLPSTGLNGKQMYKGNWNTVLSLSSMGNNRIFRCHFCRHIP